MRLLVAIVAVCLAAASCHGLQKAPEFTLNLDLPPQQRFTGAVQTIVDAHGWD
eukprot:CAMPEP_0174849908 /NCGR_PEP_ID=MMETSP1114-20130205/18153_1 /TAXON_ID=312471 /ORGANISM="Neobodo designis, Strain CCAP 1951/1" /LENGTH=52 /DNA_ID=CAMNT_0016084323 /DNA_START=26 /DNA_END=181 /DNA_ORIENTATION=+